MMMRTFVLATVLIMLSSASSFASSASFYYSDGPWMGKIIDAETKEPIEGAVIVAIWKKIIPSPTGSSSRFLNATEVLSEDKGIFTIPRYEAINMIPFCWIEGPDIFTVYKPGYSAFPGPGYKYFKYFPNSPLRVDRKALEELLKKGITVELLKLKTQEERIENIPGDPYADIRSNKLPLLYKLKNQERKIFGLEEVK